jgi:hypothetical protein
VRLRRIRVRRHKPLQISLTANKKENGRSDAAHRQRLEPRRQTRPPRRRPERSCHGRQNQALGKDVVLTRSARQGSPRCTPGRRWSRTHA